MSSYWPQRLTSTGPHVQKVLQPFGSRFGLSTLTANRTVGPRLREISGRLLLSRRRRARASVLKWPRASNPRAAIALAPMKPNHWISDVEHSQNINRCCPESCTFKPDGKTDNFPAYLTALLLLAIGFGYRLVHDIANLLLTPPLPDTDCRLILGTVHSRQPVGASRAERADQPRLRRPRGAGQGTDGRIPGAQRGAGPRCLRRGHQSPRGWPKTGGGLLRPADRPRFVQGLRRL